jgi:hypothetical protein
MGISPLVDDEGGLSVICAGAGVADAAFEALGGNDGGGLQPVCSESQSLERPPQPAAAAASAPRRAARAHNDATARR